MRKRRRSLAEGGRGAANFAAHCQPLEPAIQHTQILLIILTLQRIVFADELETVKFLSPPRPPHKRLSEEQNRNLVMVENGASKSGVESAIVKPDKRELTDKGVLRRKYWLVAL